MNGNARCCRLLLIDRFHLKIHGETKTGTVYLLEQERQDHSSCAPPSKLHRGHPVLKPQLFQET